MVTLKTTLCEGNKKGLLAEKRIREAFHNFFSIGVESIEIKCNELREQMLSEWKLRNTNDFMTEYCLSETTYHKGIEEATPTFDLCEPESIEVCIYAEKSLHTNSLVPMCVEQLDAVYKAWRLHIFLRNFDRKDETLHYTGSCTTIEEGMFHELLHTCGDLPSRGRVDGIVRYNIIGIKAVQQLLSK